jgi:predicted nucleic-acid-binding Zn-ribbon protein
MSDKPKTCSRCGGTGTYQAQVLTDHNGKQVFKTVTMTCSH